MYRLNTEAERHAGTIATIVAGGRARGRNGIEIVGIGGKRRPEPINVGSTRTEIQFLNSRCIIGEHSECCVRLKAIWRIVN